MRGLKVAFDVLQNPVPKLSAHISSAVGLFRTRKAKDRPAALIVAPSWASSGSHEVFRGQAATLKALGFETFFVAVPEAWIDDEAYYLEALTEYRTYARVEADHLGEAEFPSPRAMRRAVSFDLACEQRSVAHKATKSARSLGFPAGLKTFVKRRRPLLVVCNHFFNVPFVQRLEKEAGRKVPVVLETHDVQTNHYKWRYDLRSAARLDECLQDEIGFCARADCLIHISNSDYQAFKASIPDKRHYLIYPRIEVRKPGLAQGRFINFLIVASCNEPNAVSIVWFLDKVWRHYKGGGSLLIVGSIAELLRDNHADTYRRWKSLFAGKVEDVSAFYDRAGTVVVPVIRGEGICIKFAEAMAFGKPTLYTPLAVRGLPEQAVSIVKDGLCKDSHELLAALERTTKVDSVQPDQRSYEVHRRLFSVEAHVAAYAEVVALMLPEANASTRPSASTGIP